MLVLILVILAIYWCIGGSTLDCTSTSHLATTLCTNLARTEGVGKPELSGELNILVGSVEEVWL